MLSVGLLVAALIVTAVTIVKRALTYEDCEMTFMSPRYTKITDAPEHTLYELFRYEDNNYPSRNPPELVVLFVAGSGGSYSQARSFGSTLLKSKPEAVMYTMDFKGEMSAFLPGSVERQQRYLEKVVFYLYNKHSRKVILIGHSMGGYLTARLRMPELIEKRIVLSAPLRKLPIPNILQMGKINYGDDLVSIGGSFWDIQVPTEYSKVGKGSFVRANEIAMSWSNPNHVSIVWENGLLRAIVDYILDPSPSADYFLNTKLHLNPFTENGSEVKDAFLLKEEEEGTFIASQPIRILTNKKLGKDFEVESDCAVASVLPGTSFPETAFKKRTKTLIPTLLTRIATPQGCKFRYYKKTDGYLRLDVHRRNEEYFREMSTFMDSLDGGQNAINALRKIHIFDVSSAENEKRSFRVLYEPPRYLKNWCVLQVSVEAKKSLENNDALVIKAGNTFLHMFERKRVFTMPVVDSDNDVVLEVDKNFDQDVEINIRVDWTQSVVEVLLKNHEWLILGITVSLFLSYKYLTLLLLALLSTKQLSQVIVFSFGVVVMSRFKRIASKVTISRKMAPCLLLPYPLGIIPIFLQTLFTNRAGLLYFLPFIYDIVAVVCVFRDIIEAKAYLPYLKYTYNLPLFFFYLSKEFTGNDLLKFFLVGVALWKEVHPSWIPVLSVISGLVLPQVKS